MEEKIFLAPNGELVLSGIKQVGINCAVSFADMHSYPPNCFPEGKPQEIKHDMFWGAMQKNK